jgi:hypothetical protein
MTIKWEKTFMKRLVCEIQALVVLFAAVAFCPGISAQESHQKSITFQTKYDRQHSTPEKNNPHPEDPI